MRKKICIFSITAIAVIISLCLPIFATEISQERSDEVIAFFTEYIELYWNSTVDSSIPYPYRLPAEKYRNRETYEELGKKYLTGNMLNGYLNNLVIKAFNGTVGVLDLNLLENTPQIYWTLNGDPETDWDDLSPIKEIRDGNIIYRALAVNNIEKNPFKPANDVIVDVWEYEEAAEDWCLASSFYWFPRVANDVWCSFYSMDLLINTLQENIPQVLVKEPAYESYPLSITVRDVMEVIYSALYINNLYSNPSLYFSEPWMTNTFSVVTVEGKDYYDQENKSFLRKFDKLSYALYDIYSDELADRYLKNDSFIESSDGYVLVENREQTGRVYDITDEHLTVDIVYNENDIVKVELGLPAYDENGNFLSAEKAIVILEKKENASIDECKYVIVYEEFSELAQTNIPYTADAYNIHNYILFVLAIFSAHLCIKRRES